MALDSKNVMERLERIHAITADLKTSPVVAIQTKIQDEYCAVIPDLARQTVYDVFVRHSLVFSNMPGPDAPCYICNGKLIAGF